LAATRAPSCGAPVPSEATSSLLGEVCQNHARHTASRHGAITPLLTSPIPFVNSYPHGCPKTSYPILKSTLIDGSSFWAQHTRRNSPLVSCAFTGRFFVSLPRFLAPRHGRVRVPALTRPRPSASPTSRVDTPAHSPYTCPTDLSAGSRRLP